MSARGIAIGGGIGAAVLFAPAAQAATFTVTKLADTDDDVCNADCSLREAAHEANYSAGADAIEFASGLSGTISLTGGYVGLYESVTVSGPGASALTVSGNDLDRVFAVNAASVGDPGDPVTISGLTMTEGRTGVNDGGGAVQARFTDLTIADSVLSDSHADRRGGALYSRRRNADDHQLAVHRQRDDGRRGSGSGSRQQTTATRCCCETP